MDQTALVNAHVKDGRKLIDYLISNGLDIEAAGWVKAGNDDRWRLYLLCPAIDTEGVLGRYRTILAAVRDLGLNPMRYDVQSIPPIHEYDVRLIGSTDPLASLLAGRTLRSNAVEWEGSPTFNDHSGGIPIDGAFVYRLPAPQPA